MRRFGVVLGAVAAAAMMMLAVPGTAYASTGTLTVNGQSFEDPASGCYPSDAPGIEVQNGTDGAVYIYESTDCAGDASATVAPGESGTGENGQSLLIE